MIRGARVTGTIDRGVRGVSRPLALPPATANRRAALRGLSAGPTNRRVEPRLGQSATFSPNGGGSSLVKPLTGELIRSDFARNREYTFAAWSSEVIPRSLRTRGPRSRDSPLECDARAPSRRP